MIKRIITGDFRTNTYLIQKDHECILIDPGLDFKDTAKKIKSEFDVKAILITHGHMDHIDGIQYFDVPVYFPKKDKDFLVDDTLSLYRLFGGISPFKNKNLSLILVDDGMQFDLLGETFFVLSTPGHTIGSVCYKMKEQLWSGDTLFHMSAGRTDFPTGNQSSLNKSLQKLMKLNDSIIVYPGHEEATTIGEERRKNPFLMKI